MTKSNFVPVYTNSNRFFIDSDYCCFRQHRTRLVVGLSDVWIMRNRRPKVSISFFYVSMATMTKSNFVLVFTNSNRFFIDSDYRCFRQHRSRLVAGLSDVWIGRNHCSQVSMSFVPPFDDGDDDKVKFCSGLYNF